MFIEDFTLNGQRRFCSGWDTVEDYTVYVNKDWQLIWGRCAKLASCDQLTQPEFMPTLLDQLIIVAGILRMTTLYYGYLCCP